MKHILLLFILSGLMAQGYEKDYVLGTSAQSAVHKI